MNRSAARLHVTEDGGFTVLELMIVLLIIGILLGIAIGVYSAATGSANTAACQENQGILNRAIAVARAGGADVDDIADLEDCVVNFNSASRCPLDGTPLIYDTATDFVTCPNHP